MQSYFNNRQFFNTYLNNVSSENYCNKSKSLEIENLIIGKKYFEAIKIYDNLRIVKEDNKNIIFTLNYCKDRCNIEVKNGIIIKVNGYY